LRPAWANQTKQLKNEKKKTTNKTMISIVGLIPLFHFYSLGIEQYISNFNVFAGHLAILQQSRF
jgi:hypothetical protein